jgi:predicted phosphodiesterase
MAHAVTSRWATLVLSMLAVSACGGYERPRLPTTDAAGWAFGEEEAVPVDDDSVVFAAIGDVGKANVPQAVVAAGVRRACAERCDFVVLLGDNVYESGVADADDERALGCMIASYETPATFAVLGNHDYDPVAPTVERARRELAWIRRDATRPDGVGARGDHHFYRFRAGPVRLVALDTNLLVRGAFDEADYGRLARWLGPLRRADDEWLVVLGHHPYVSNGSHRSAGEFLDASLSLWPGRFFRHVIGRHVMGRADLYVAGHDHNLQFIPDVDGGRTAQIVSGGGSKCDAPPSLRFHDNAIERYGYGFVIVEADRDALSVAFHDAWGELLWNVRRERGSGWQTRGDLSHLAERRSHCASELERMEREAPTPCRPD